MRYFKAHLCRGGMYFYFIHLLLCFISEVSIVLFYYISQNILQQHDDVQLIKLVLISQTDVYTQSSYWQTVTATATH